VSKVKRFLIADLCKMHNKFELNSGRQAGRAKSFQIFKAFPLRERKICVILS
jgi:hypothetical protein